MNKEEIYDRLKDYKGHVKVNYSPKSNLSSEIFYLECFDKDKNPVLKTSFNEPVLLTDIIISISKHNLLGILKPKEF